MLEIKVDEEGIRRQIESDFIIRDIKLQIEQWRRHQLDKAIRHRAKIVEIKKEISEKRVEAKKIRDQIAALQRAAASHKAACRFVGIPRLNKYNAQIARRERAIRKRFVFEATRRAHREAIKKYNAKVVS